MDTDTYLLHCFSAVGVAEVDKSTESTVVSLGCMQQGLICHMKAEFRHQEIIDERATLFRPWPVWEWKYVVCIAE